MSFLCVSVSELFLLHFFLEENQLKWRIALEYSKKEKKDNMNYIHV